MAEFRMWFSLDYYWLQGPVVPYSIELPSTVTDKYIAGDCVNPSFNTKVVVIRLYLILVEK